MRRVIIACILSIFSPLVCHLSLKWTIAFQHRDGSYKTKLNQTFTRCLWRICSVSQSDLYFSLQRNSENVERPTQKIILWINAYILPCIIFWWFRKYALRLIVLYIFHTFLNHFWCHRWSRCDPFSISTNSRNHNEIQSYKHKRPATEKA